MNANDLIETLVEWVQETVPALAAAYPYQPASKPDPMPDAVVEVNRSFVQTGGGELFPFWQLQQRMVEGYEVELAFMVPNDDPAAAAEQLRGFHELLSEAVRTQPTLAGRVPFRSPFVAFDFTPPFVEYEDGTTGREMTMTLTIGDLVEETE